VIYDQEIMRNDVKFLQHIVHGGYMDTYIYMKNTYSAYKTCTNKGAFSYMMTTESYMIKKLCAMT
jgi:hypothetical protein